MTRILILFSYLFLFINMGMKAVIIPAYLLEANVSEVWVGIVFAMELIASIPLSYLLPQWIKHQGETLVYSVLIACASSVMVLLPFSSQLWQWMALSAVLGIGLMGGFTVLQSIYNQHISSQNRGFFLGLSTLAACTGLTVGPLLIGLVEGNLMQACYISAAVTVVAVIPFWMAASGQAQAMPNRPVKWAYFIKRQPLVFATKFVQEFVLASFFAMGTVYLVAQGHSVVAAGYGFSALAASAVVDMITGTIVDRVNPKRMIQLGATLFAISFALLIGFVQYFWAMIVLLFAVGVAAGMMYLSLTTLLNNRFPAKTLVSANAACQLVGCVGAIAGAVVSGGLMVISVGSYPYLMIGVLGLFLISTYFLKA